MRKEGYKANRPTANQIELNYQKRQLRTLEETLERWHRVNKKLTDKGHESRHDNEKIKKLEEQINAKRQSIQKISINN